MSRPLAIRLLASLALTLGACAASGSSRSQSAGAGGSSAARAALAPAPLSGAGARCPGGACVCRQVDDQGRTIGETIADEGSIADGHKRFELRTGRGTERLQITIGGRGTLDKSGATVEPTCGYVDLAPGEHRVHVRARAPRADEGMAPAVLLYEYGAETHDWYQSFAWRCGADGPCKKVDLEDFAQAMGRRSRGIFDPCGSARVSHVTWQIEHGADYKIEDLTLDFVLHVYKFVPRARRGGTCKGLPQE